MQTRCANMESGTSTRRSNRFDVSYSGETTTIDRHSRAHEIQVEETLRVHGGCVSASGKIRASLSMMWFQETIVELRRQVSTRTETGSSASQNSESES